MKTFTALVASLLLMGCSNKSVITIGDSDVLNALINVPRAISEQMNASECEYQPPEDRADCRAKQQKRVDELTKEMKKKDH